MLLLASLVVLLVEHRQKPCIPQQVYTRGAPVGRWGVPQTPSKARNGSCFCTCQRSVCLLIFQFKCIPVNPECCAVQKHDGCWWFGQSGRCGSWNILITTFMVAAGTDFLLVDTKIWLGNQSSSKSPRTHRYSSQSNRKAAAHLHAAPCVSHFATEKSLLEKSLLESPILGSPRSAQKAPTGPG